VTSTRPRPLWQESLPARRARRDLPLLVVAGFAAALAYLLVHRSLVDDSYITMTYARNLAFHLHWGLVPGETANSATSPLNVLLLAAITAVVRSPVLAVGVLFVVTVVLTARWLADLSDQLSLSRATPWIGTALLLPSPLLLSTVGLESYLCAALFVGLVRYGAAGRPVSFGIVAGLAVLARPDLGVVVLVTAVGFPEVRRRLLLAVGAAVAVAAPWHLWSWFVLGSALPDTLVVKAGQGAWAGFGFGTGPVLYLIAFPAAAALSFLPVVLGGVGLVVVVLRALRARRCGPVERAAGVSGLAAIAHYGAYSFLSTPPYHWYYVPLIAGMSVCATLVVGRALAGGRTASALAVAAVPVVLALAMVAVDLLHGTPWSRSVIGSNWASPAEYERIGRDLRPLLGTQAVGSPGEIGTIAYYCECAIVDEFSDRGRMIEMIEARETRSGPIARALIGLNYLHLDRSEAPRPVVGRLEFRKDEPSARARSWPVRHWAEGPGWMVLAQLR
jgi:hypothetical protein